VASAGRAAATAEVSSAVITAARPQGAGKPWFDVGKCRGEKRDLNDIRIMA
jgi:hypothetical protein